MATLYSQQSKNKQKTWLLMTSFFLVVIGLGWFFSYYYANEAILVIAVVFALIMNIASYWWSDKIVLKLHKAKEVTRESNRELWNIVENLSITAGLPMPKLYIIEERAPNAFATGRNPEHAVVAVTTGLLDILDRSELEGVIAHELAHIGNRDILVSTVVVVLVGFITLLSDIFIRSTFFGGSRQERGGGVIALVGIALAILSPLVATVIQLAVSRKREFLADASGALLTRYPEGLASALQKISGHSGEMRSANHATAHLFISNPFGETKKGGKQKASFLTKMFSTHPPVEERVNALLGKNYE